MKKIKNEYTSIKNWASDDQPSYKLIKSGVNSLSNAELLAILLRTGTQHQSAVELSRKILETSKNNLHELAKMGLKDLQKMKGIGETKSIIIAAALELGRRRHSSDFLRKPQIRCSTDIAEYLKSAFQDLAYEIFAVVYLNRANKIVHFEIISRGGITGTVADPRLILKFALEHNATSIVLSHNHPSGNLQPSKADEDITSKINHAAAFLDIKLLDHIIVSNEGYFSFMDEGLL